MDLVRRTRRNADTIRGAAPNVTINPAAAVHVGARPYHRIGVVESNRQTHGPLRPNAFYPTAQRLQSTPIQLTIILDSGESPADAVPQNGQLTSPAIPHGPLGQAVSSEALATA